MATFPATVTAPYAGSSVSSEARVLKATFGDGYAQRAADGINTITDQYQLTWENIDRSEALIIINFLRSMGGYQSFYWTPPGESVARLWTCDKWQRNNVSGVLDTVNATFTECFDLA